MGQRVKREKKVKKQTHIDAQVQQVERTWIRDKLVLGGPAHEAPDRVGGGRCARGAGLELDVDAATGEDGHEDVDDMDEHGADNLLGDVEEPDLNGPLGPLPPALIHQGQQSQGAQRHLHNQGEGPQ